MKTCARAILAILSLMATHLAAQMMRPLPVAELSQKADLIVQGFVQGKVCQRDSDGGIYTTVDVITTEVWKGRPATNRLSIVYSGGTFGHSHLEVSGQVDYTPNEEVLVFLVTNPAGELVTLGMSQGKFHVWQEPASGEKFACNPFHGTPANRNASDPMALEPLPLPHLKEQVKGVTP